MSSKRSKKHTPPPEASKVLLAVVDSAVVWWAMKRPIPWSLAAHLNNPVINCVGSSERNLASAVAEWCRIQEGRS